MKNVSFSYGEKIVLSNLNLKVKKGEILGIIGENGCGKSTIINLLIGLYTPKKGCIYKSSKEIQTVVFQDFSRFLFTLKENIGFGQLEYINDTQLIWNTIENVGLYGKVKGFRDEINTKMGKELYENGRELSGGEWQKLATGRAEFRNADIFIFDEPTSFLDPIEEKRLVNMLKQIFKGKSVILVTHRIGLLSLVDRIVYIQDGDIKEDGTHTELMMQRAEYYKFYNNQAKWYR